MTCANLSNNIEIKSATSNLLSSIYKYTKKIEYLPVPGSIFNTMNKDFYNDKNININLDDIETGKENLVTIDEDENIYINCVYQSSLPWYTTSADKKKCEVIPDIILPEDRLILDKKTLTVTPIFKSSNKEKPAFCTHEKNVNKAYCENRWYDWIITPNYYLGNTYYKDNSHYTEVDVYKCYAPCDGDNMPYTTTNGEFKCIPKKFFSNGIFSDKYMFCSFGLINLIGNIALYEQEKEDYKSNLLFILHQLVFQYNIDNNYDEKLYDINDKYKKYLQEFNKNNYTDIYKEFEDVINNIILKNFNTTSEQDYSNTNEFTYKHRKFNENESDMYSFNGLNVCGVLIDPVLIHTWMLANLFKPFYDTETVEIKKIISIINSDSNKLKIIDSLLYTRLNKIFKDENKAIRLKNIFFKAVNICYNNKTNFSANIIQKTKLAFNNEKIINIIKEKKYYNFINNIFIYNILINKSDLSDLSYSDGTKITNNLGDYIDNILKETKITDFQEYQIKKDVEITDTALVNNDDNLYKFKYYFSMEKLERPTCDKGYEWNSKYSVCDPIKNFKKIGEEEKKLDDDEFQIPELSNILRLFVQIILIIIVIYIIYIFYDIFGEVLIALYNNLYILFKKFLLWFYKSTAPGDEYEKEVYKLQQDKQYIDNKYKNIENKFLKIDEYMKTHDDSNKDNSGI